MWSSPSKSLNEDVTYWNEIPLLVLNRVLLNHITLYKIDYKSQNCFLPKWSHGSGSTSLVSSRTKPSVSLNTSNMPTKQGQALFISCDTLVVYHILHDEILALGFQITRIEVEFWQHSRGSDLNFKSCQWGKLPVSLEHTISLPR